MVPLNKFWNYCLIEVHTEGVEELSKRNASVHISNNYHVSSLIEVTYDVFHFQFAVHVLNIIILTFLRRAHDHDALVFESVEVFKFNFVLSVRICNLDLVFYGLIVSWAGK